MGARRLERPLHPDAVVGRSVRAHWDGREIDAREGEPLAVSLLANGETTISRSFRFHRPRGLMCSTGSCGWCECEVDGLPSVRSCRVPVREGLAARGEHAWPSVGRDFLGILDVGNRLVTPGFYHHRFLRPARFRKAYLDVIRAFGGRGRMRPGSRPTRTGIGLERAIEADVVVVGAGRTGLTAALAATATGARVVLVEADDEAGGSARWATGPSGPGPEARALAEGASARLGDGLLLDSTAVARDGDVLHVVGSAGLVAVRAPVVIAATGSHERPPLVPGGERPGVMGARTVERLLERWGVLPGERAALVGDDATTAAAGRLLERAGATVAARIPEGSLTRIDGRGRVERVRWTEGGHDRSAAVDLVVVGRRVPGLELATLAGARLAWRASTLAPVLDETGRTSVPWLFVVGSATGMSLGEEASRLQAADAGRAAADAARSGVGRGADVAGVGGGPVTVSVSGGRGIVTAGGRAAPAGGRAGRIPLVRPADAHVCYCEDVRVHDILRERAAGYEEPESLKRRTGALTGPCQGKYCLDRFLALCGPTPDDGPDFVLPTARPPMRPVRVSDLASREDGA